MEKRKKQKSPKGALIKGMSKNLPSDILTDLVFKKKLRELLRGYAGIYALYKGDRLYIETLIQQIVKPKGNRVKGKVPRKYNLNYVLREVLREHEKRIKRIKKALR